MQLTAYSGAIGGLLLMVSATGAWAEQQTSVSSSEQQGTALHLKLPDGMGERICWFDDHRYSLGAIVKSGEETLICAPQNPHETNGALSWHPLAAEKETQTQQGDSVILHAGG
ncbi:MAG: DUF1496 domain-containing protein [Aeromonas sp.]